LVSFTYDGHERVVVPAAYGTHKTTGNPMLRGYQIRGTSASRTPPLWDLFLVEKMVGFAELDETFADDPPLYERGDKHLNVECEL
jgi:hypothetical protein